MTAAPVLYLPGPADLACCDWQRPLHAAPSLTNLGHSALVPVNEGVLVTIVDLQAKCTLGEMIAVAIGLECLPGCSSLPVPPNTPVDAVVLPRIYLTWSLGAATFRAAVDGRNGLVVNLPADSVQVQAVVLAFSPDGVDPAMVATPGAVRISAGFAYGCGNVCANAQLTQAVFAPAGTIQTIPIPPFANEFALVPLGTSTITAEVRTDGGPGPWPTYTATGPDTGGPRFALVNGARCLAIDNTAGSDTAKGFVIFSLQL